MMLLIIRPQPGTDETARAAKEMAINAIVMPLFEVRSIDWTPPDLAQMDAVMITSANAIHFGGAGLATLTNLPVYAVGDKSAAAARAAGFKVVWSGKFDANALLSAASANGCRKLFWPAGADKSELAVPGGITIHAISVYNSAILPASPEMLALLQLPVCVALHSVRASRYFLAICETHNIDKQQITVFALSQKISDAIGQGWAYKLVADCPDDTSLLSKVKSFFTSLPRDP
jgi:uroporphyrinogen-III synthase